MAKLDPVLELGGPSLAPGIRSSPRTSVFYLFRLSSTFRGQLDGSAALRLVLIVTAVFAYLNGGIRLQSP